ncbi:hypothetical protein [Flavobacterium haoranii]|nr:hypothetical protein [Flavobacterium haoranii]
MSRISIFAYMKWATKIVLLLFFLFLATPTIVKFVDSTIDVSYFYNMAEEEENHSCFNEIKMVAFTVSQLVFNFSIIKKPISIFSTKNIGFNSILVTIFLPPPELV